MPVIAGRTREQLRVAVGLNLGAIYVSSATTTASSTTTLIDATLAGGDGVFNGDYLVFTSGSNAGVIQKITGYVQSTFTLTFDQGVTTVASGDTYELWSEQFNPLNIHEYMNSAILDATGRTYDHEEDTSLHGDLSKSRYDVPTQLDMLLQVQYRVHQDSRQIIGAGIVWDESIDADFTVAQDVEDFLFGRISTRFTIGSGVSAGDIASDSIGSLDFSRYTHIEFPMKVRDAVASDDLRLRLSNTTNGSSTTEEITIPALVARTDTWIRVRMSTPEATTAIISVALEYNANQGDNIVWLGEVRATDAESAIWKALPRKLWRLESEARDLIFTRAGQQILSYSLIKLIGGDKPILLTTDSMENEIDDWYVISRTTELALSSLGRSRSQQEEASLSRWGQRADEAMRSFSLGLGRRVV